jgi:DNA repair exonuclease SbcCD ATPase subunit
MAEKDYQIKISVDTTGAIKGIDGITEALTGVESETDKTTQRISELQKVLQTFDPKTKQWQDAAREFKELGGNTNKLNSGLKDLQNTLASTAPDTDEWNALNQVYIDLGGSVQELTDVRLSKLQEELQTLDPNSDKWKEASAEFTRLGGTLPVEPAKSLKAQIRELTNILTSGQIAEGTAEYQALKDRISELKDKSQDLNQEIGAGAGNAIEKAKGNFGLLRERLLNLDFEGVGESVKGFASAIKNFSFKSITDGVKGVISSFRALTAALLSNPITAILVGITLAVAGIVAAFSFMQDKARENTAKANNEIDKQADYRKQQEKKELAEVGNNAKKQYELKRQFAQNEINDTSNKIKNLERLQRSNYGLSEDQEKELDTLRKQYSQQRVDYEILAIERMNALNQARVDLDRKFNQIGLTERQKAQQDIELARIDEKKRLVALGATQADLEKSDAVFRAQRAQLDANYAKQDASAAKSKADARKSANEQETNDLNSYREKVLAIQRELAASSQTEEQKELEAVRLKYEELEKEAVKNKQSLDELKELQKQEELAIETKYNKLLLDEVRRAQEELQQEIDAYALENEEANKTAQQKELEKIGEYYFQRIETLKSAGQDASGLIAEQAAKEQEVRDKYAQERLNKEREIEDIRLMASTAGLPALQAQYEIEKVELQRQYEDKIALAKKNGEDVTGLEAEYQQKQLEAAAAFQQARINQSLDAASGWLTSLSQLNNAFEGKTEAERKKAFNRNKTLQIAQTLIETYKAAQGAYTAQMSIPTPDAPIRGAVAAAAAVAVGLANVAKIRATQYTSSTTPPSNTTGGGSSATPSFNTTGGAPPSNVPSMNPFQQLVQNRPDQITPRAFVLAGDVASATEAREKVQNLARLG